MSHLKRLEKQRRRAAFRSYVLSVELSRVFGEKRSLEAAIKKIRRERVIRVA